MDKMEFFKSRIRLKIEDLKPFMSDTKYKLYMSILSDCNNFDEIREMADLDLQINMINYVRKINDKLKLSDTNIEELEAVTNSMLSASKLSIIKPRKKTNISIKNDIDLSTLDEDIEDEEILELAANLLFLKIQNEPECEKYNLDEELDIDSILELDESELLGEGAYDEDVENLDVEGISMKGINNFNAKDSEIDDIIDFGRTQDENNDNIKEKEGINFNEEDSVEFIDNSTDDYDEFFSDSDTEEDVSDIFNSLDEEIFIEEDDDFFSDEDDNYLDIDDDSMFIDDDDSFFSEDEEDVGDSYEEIYNSLYLNDDLFKNDNEYDNFFSADEDDNFFINDEDDNFFSDDEADNFFINDEDDNFFINDEDDNFFSDDEAGAGYKDDIFIEDEDEKEDDNLLTDYIDNIDPDDLFEEEEKLDEELDVDDSEFDIDESELGIDEHDEPHEHSDFNSYFDSDKNNKANVAKSAETIFINGTKQGDQAQSMFTALTKIVDGTANLVIKTRDSIAKLLD